MREDRRKALHKVGRAAAIAILVLSLLFVVLNTTLAIQRIRRPGDIPVIFGISPLFVMSDSMAPAIRIEDLILFRWMPAARLKEGDIIVFQLEDARYSATHRIVKITVDDGGRRTFITKGDANNAEDTYPVEESRVFGRYFMRIPRIGKLVEFFIIRPNGIVISVSAPLLLFLIIDMLRRLFGKRYQLSEGEAKDELEYLRALAADLSEVSQDAAQEDDDAQSGLPAPDDLANRQ